MNGNCCNRECGAYGPAFILVLFILLAIIFSFCGWGSGFGGAGYGF